MYVGDQKSINTGGIEDAASIGGSLYRKAGILLGWLPAD
jgi:hypothetical protein